MKYEPQRVGLVVKAWDLGFAPSKVSSLKPPKYQSFGATLGPLAR